MLPRHVPQQSGWRASRLRRLGYRSYDHYLHGAHWAAVRERYWSAPETPKACFCGEADRRNLELHHRTYLRLGNEPLDDLRALCHQCHNDIHVLASRNLVRYDLDDYDDVRRRIIYALEYRARRVRDGADAASVPNRPFDEHHWDLGARVRRAETEGRRDRARRLVIGRVGQPVAETPAQWVESAQRAGQRPGQDARERQSDTHSPVSVGIGASSTDPENMVTRQRTGLLRRFYRQVREAALRATTEEALQLERLVDAVRIGEVDVAFASDCLRSLLREQHGRAFDSPVP